MKSIFLKIAVTILWSAWIKPTGSKDLAIQLKYSFCKSSICVKCPNTKFFLVRILPHWDWIREIRNISRIQSECGKIQTRKNFVFGHFAQCLKKKFENRVNQVIINCFVFYSCPFLTYQFLIFHFLTSQISSGFKNIQWNLQIADTPSCGHNLNSG